ncbi:MAG: SpoIVB peptidase [Oscillospiraceae bacterium]|nr:SpoIVB peptidase [Oscillospiraceae bacterium]
MEITAANPQHKRRQPASYLNKIKPLAMVLAAVIAMAFAPNAAAANLIDEPRTLVPMGNTVGISLKADGVMVVSVPDTCSDGKSPSPAKAAGMKPGDIITRIGASRVTSGDELKRALAAVDGTSVAVLVSRDGAAVQLNLTPHAQENGNHTLGVMVRDGINGIGTVTYVDPASGEYGALGHSVSDNETGLILPLRTGEITKTSVTSVTKGQPGTPGQLRGIDNTGADIIGSITENSEHGIFGVMAQPEAARDALPAADDSELHTGDAVILSNVSGSEVREYKIEISRVYSGAESDSRSMLVTVKDPELIAQTGGIVQGMSGSPIIQDGKLVGAVTHVLIGNPEKGYGVSISKMLDMADDQKLNLAA